MAAIRRYDALDPPPQKELDDLTGLAAHICEAPMAFITLVDDERQWFKAQVGDGFYPSELPREESFCAHAIVQSQLFVVPDAAKDERFADNRYVVASHTSASTPAPPSSPATGRPWARCASWTACPASSAKRRRTRSRH